MNVFKENNKYMKRSVYYSILYIAFVIALGFGLFKYEESISTKEVDAKLISSSKIVNLFLKDDFLNQRFTKVLITSEQDCQNILNLTKLANILEVQYIYTYIKRGDNLYFTSSSATKEELKTKINLTHYFDKYEEVSTADKNVFKEKKFLIEEISDKWGKFRTILIPFTNKQGEINVIGIDIRIDTVNNMLIMDAIKHTVIIIILTIIILLPPFISKIKHMKSMSHFDLLTGLPNRFEFQDKSEYVFNLNKRKKESFTVLFLDLDGFKNINDTYGHEAGDLVLIEVAERIKKNIRGTDIPCRQGGDEFVISLPSTTIKGAMILAEKLLKETTRPFMISGHKIESLSFSIGIAVWKKGKTEDFKDLCKEADTAMYKAKKYGKNRIEVYS